ncbi:MAG: HDOD domain-containing protein, partial [Pseudomonadota bacterium]
AQEHAMDDLVQQLLPLVEYGQLPQPTLPSMAQKVLQATKSNSLTTEQLAELVEQDPAIAAHLVKIANSPLVGCPNDITDLRTAIGLFGVRYCSQLAVSLALKQLFRAQQPVITEIIGQTWSDCTRVANLCMVMAKDYGINQGTAYLSGLLHRIGALPILRWLDEQTDINIERTAIQQLLHQHQAELGEQLLDDWGFPPALCVIPHTFANLDHPGKAGTDSAQTSDLVAAAYHFLSVDRHQWQDCKVLDRLGVGLEEVQKKMMAWQSLAAQGGPAE